LYDKIIDLLQRLHPRTTMRKRTGSMPSGWQPQSGFRTSDSTLIRDASLIERGMDSKDAAALAAKSLKSVFSRGLPLFAEASSLLNDLFFYAQKATGADQLTERQLDFVRKLLAAFQPAGLSFGFFGESPSRPVVAQEARRATLAVDLQRRLRYLGADVFTDLVGLVDPGPSRIRTASRALTVAVKGVTDVLEGLADEQPAAPGDVSRTLFMKDVYRGGSDEVPVQLLTR
jgi:hypothetical protein